MTLAFGTNAVIKTAIESTYKTVPSSFDANVTAIIQAMTDESVNMNENQHESKMIKSNRTGSRAARGRFDVGGAFNFDLTPHFYALLAYTFGSRSTLDSLSAPITENATGVGTAPYTHTFKVGTLPSFTYEKGFPDLGTPKYFQYSGSRVNSIGMNFPDEGFITCNLDIVSSLETIAGTSMSPTYTSSYPVKPFDGLEMLAADIKVGGSAVAYLTNLSIRVDNNLSRDLYILGGLGIRKGLPAGVVRVTGTCTAFLDDTTGADTVALLSAIANNTETSIDIKLTRGTGLGGVDNESIQFKMDELTFRRTAPQISGPTGIMIPLAFTAYYDNDADASDIQVILKNNYPPRL